MDDAVPPASAGHPPPAWLQRLAAVSWRFVVIVLAGAMVLSAVVALDALVLPVFLSLLFACALLPVHRGLLRRKLRPGAAAALSLLLLMVLLAGAAALTAHALVSESGTIAGVLDEGYARMAATAADAELVSPDQAQAADHVPSGLVERLRPWLLGGAVTIVSTTVDLVTTLFLSLFITFFLLKDGGMMWRWLVDYLGNGSPLLDATGRRSFGALSGYVRGAALVSAVDATVIGLGAWALGVPFAGAILVLTFVMGFVPFVGAVLAGAFAALLALANGGWGPGIAMIVIVVVVQQLESNLLQPVIMSRSTALHPLVVALASVAGGAIAGLLGVFVAVPLAAAVVAALAALRDGGFFDSGPGAVVRTARPGAPR